MRFAYFTLAFLGILTVSVLGFRGKTSQRPPIEVFPDMDHQAKYKPQAGSKFFADGRADRPTPAGVVPRGRSVGVDADFLRADDAKYLGKNPDGTFVNRFPVEVTESLIRRGGDRYQIYCAPCHGALGDGNGITKSYGMVVTPSYHDDLRRALAEGELYHIVANGKNTMQGYADKLSVSDRWAVVAYVRALQRAANGRIDDVPLEKRGDLK